MKLEGWAWEQSSSQEPAEFEGPCSLPSMARQTDARVWESQCPGDLSPGLRVVDTGEPGSGRRHLLHDHGPGRGCDQLSSFLSPLLTSSGLCSRLEVCPPGVAGRPGDRVPETTGQAGQRVLLFPPAGMLSTLPRRPQGPGTPSPTHFSTPFHCIFTDVHTLHTHFKLSQRIAHHLCSSPLEKKSLLVTVQKKKL